MALILGAIVLVPVPGCSGHDGASGYANAQTTDPRQSGADAIRQRRSELDAREGRATSPYWEHFELMNTGKCADAVPGLTNLAERGRGFEKSQHALGLCLIETGRDAEGLEWISQAADAGLAAAQATHVRLFVRRGADYMAPAQAAMWLQLYETNPMRLLIGTGHALDSDARKTASDMIPRTAWLDGVARARHWTPRFAGQTVNPDAPIASPGG